MNVLIKPKPQFSTDCWYIAWMFLTANPLTCAGSGTCSCSEWIHKYLCLWKSKHIQIRQIGGQIELFGGKRKSGGITMSGQVHILCASGRLCYFCLFFSGNYSLTMSRKFGLLFIFLSAKYKRVGGFSYRDVRLWNGIEMGTERLQIRWSRSAFVPQLCRIVGALKSKFQKEPETGVRNPELQWTIGLCFGIPFPISQFFRFIHFCDVMRWSQWHQIKSMQKLRRHFFCPIPPSRNQIWTTHWTPWNWLSNLGHFGRISTISEDLDGS